MPSVTASKLTLLGLFWRNSTQWAMTFSIMKFLDYNDVTHSIGSSGRVIRSTQRPLPDNTQHSQQTNRHPCRRRNSNPQSQPASGHSDLR
jgi:hypothetical protein